MPLLGQLDLELVCQLAVPVPVPVALAHTAQLGHVLGMEVHQGNLRPGGEARRGTPLVTLLKYSKV